MNSKLVTGGWAVALVLSILVAVVGGVWFAMLSACAAMLAMAYGFRESRFNLAFFGVWLVLFLVCVPAVSIGRDSKGTSGGSSSS